MTLATALALTLAAQPGTDTDVALLRPIEQFHAGLAGGRPEQVLEAIGPSLTFFQGRTGDHPSSWEPHLHLQGEALRTWPARFLAEAGPYRNEFEVVSRSVRGDAAIVVTRDTGRNAFRSWRDEEVAWLLGREGGAWRIVGLYVLDIQLPSH